MRIKMVNNGSILVKRGLGFAGVFFFLINTIAAQNYNRKLNWQAELKRIATIDNTFYDQPTFAEAGHSEALGLLPMYREYIPMAVAGNVKVEVANAVYSPALNVDAKSLQYIESAIVVNAALAMERKKPAAFVEILPFRKSGNGQIEKLESFTLKLTVVPVQNYKAGNAFSASSVLASGTWYKVGVSKDGIYKIDYNFLKNVVKIVPENVSISTLAIFGNGGGMVPDENAVPRADDLLENPTLVVDNNGNNRFDDGDYLLFYGTMADAWRYNSSTKQFSHEKNLYVDQNIYFLTTNRGTGKRVQTAAAPGAPTVTVTQFDERLFHESDEENMLKSGKRWLGDKMTSFSNTKTHSFSLPNLVTSSPVRIVSAVGAKTTFGSNTQVSVNGQFLLSHPESGIPPSGYPDGDIPSVKSANFSSSSETITVTHTFNVTNNPTGTASTYIDWIEVFAKRALTLVGSVMNFRSVESVGAGNVSEFRLNNASAETRVWDVTDPGAIYAPSASLSGSQLSVITETATMREFVAFNSNGSFAAPQLVSQVSNQDLHAIGQPRMVIVTPAAFFAPSNELANFHRSYNGYGVEVVDVEKIYNEFGGGKKDISAIRDFMRMLYERAGTDTSKMPRYLLLMGDGSFDPKNRVTGNQEFIPTYQSYESVKTLNTYTSDDFFGLLDPNEGGEIASLAERMDISVGRLPVASESEAWEVVNKIKNYKQPLGAASCVEINNNNSWRNRLTFVADDLDDGGLIFMNSANVFADQTRAVYPQYNYDKILLDAYKQVSTPAGARYPDANTAILNRINTGTLVVNYIGHGGETNWASERIFNMSDVLTLNNGNKLPLFITATCEFSRFDLVDRTAGEWLLVNGKGGAIGSLTTVRLVFASANDDLNRQALKFLFLPYEGRFPTMGEIMSTSKNTATFDPVNMRKFTLLGDPALTLNYPQNNVVTTEVNNKPITLNSDTLKALSQVTIRGEVRDYNGNKMTSFNGVVFPVVYDKISTLKTLGNDAASFLTFTLFKNLLFKGKASVTNGDFSFTFIVPKDIDYQYGLGRISYYADNGNGVDANGYNEQLVIGGSADSFMADGVGPKINLFMNDRNFVFGGMTDPNPILLAVMEDETGINTTGNGVGHDITAILDENTQNAIILNDYYESALDTFNRGEVKYPFAKLAEGKHTLRVKAWDIHNNSSEEYTEFIVAASAKLALNHVYNYPNPFTTRTQFMFEHNRPCDNLKVVVQIYSVAGKLVKSLQTETFCEGYRVDDITWDGRDDYGDLIGKGVYVYKLQVRDSQGNTAHKFEKLVVLR